ncbi:hypothetical protein BK784_38730 [Bacillus thuringiensis serovar medellin]|uniref:Uncharacterized protein n=1 Tax=Bacillus thuringiensis subsp. medellin TaxID=79672 RepID=A0A9X6MKS9_BACTV|nr:hypothetical protein [Bacillus thuringiensis]OUB82172.1 hypothetical protein BK784_38730 [Bacillus thuringiensis serovar medellin]
MQSYSAPELRAEYEPVVDALGNRLEGIKNDLGGILNPTNRKLLEAPITPVKKETEMFQIDPDLKHLPEEQQIQLMKQRKTYDEELAAYNHLQDSIKKSYDARINSLDSTSQLEVFQRSCILKRCLQRGMN